MACRLRSAQHLSCGRLLGLTLSQLVLVGLSDEELVAQAVEIVVELLRAAGDV